MQQFFCHSVLDGVKPEERKGDEPLRVVIVLSRPVFLARQYKVEPASSPKDPMPAAVALLSDDLEHTLKLLDAKVFPIISPEQFRKALATILADIERM